MADVYSLNPSIFPQRQVPKDHHRKVVASVIVAGIAVLVGVLYWWIVAQEQVYVPPSIVNAPSSKDTVSALINSVPASQASPTQAASISKQISSPPKTSASASDKQKIADIINNK